MWLPPCPLSYGSLWGSQLLCHEDPQATLVKAYKERNIGNGHVNELGSQLHSHLQMAIATARIVRHAEPEPPAKLLPNS